MNQKIERPVSTTLSDCFGLSPTALKYLARRGLRDLFGLADGDEWYRRGASLWEGEHYKEAVNCFARGLRLDPNHPALQFYLGLAYYNGTGVPRVDHARAVRWWCRAAEQGCAQAQNNLGHAYEQGDGVERDYNKAAYWYRKAARENHLTGQFNLAVLYEVGRGVAQDLTQAAEWYRRAAEQGHAPAQYNLGVLLRLGLGVEQNLAQAAWWYRKAAHQKYALAQFNLAAMYERGEGVSANLASAAFWYHQAIENGEESARQALAETLKKLGTHRRQF